MKPSGIVRRIDELGRIVLPIEMRRTMGLEERDPVEICLCEDSVVLKKYQPTCVFCSAKDDLLDFRGKRVCHRCLSEMKEQDEE